MPGHVGPSKDWDKLKPTPTTPHRVPSWEETEAFLEKQKELDKVKPSKPVVPKGTDVTPIMPPVTEDGLKKSKNVQVECVKYVEENLKDYTPITSMALDVLKESPSALQTTNFLLTLLVMVTERTHPKEGGGSYFTMLEKNEEDTQ